MARKHRENIDRDRPPKRPTINVDLSDIAGKVDAGERLSAEDGLALFQSADLLTVGLLANLDRERRHGDNTYYNVNRHLNPTNVCIVGCELCALRFYEFAQLGFQMTIENRHDPATNGNSCLQDRA
jgi:aminodeoxyfutalosine synthase